MDNRIYVIILVLLLLGGVGLSFSGLLNSQDDPPNAVIIDERDVVSIKQDQVVDINRADPIVPEPITTTFLISIRFKN